VTDDPIGDALHADAEAARAEIRAKGIVCPSCSVNMADLPDGHMLTLSGDGKPDEKGMEHKWTAQCSSGKLVRLSDDVPMGDADYQTWQAAVNISLYDDFRKREDEVFARLMLGSQP
jgi:hypothetical protein